MSTRREHGDGDVNVSANVNDHLRHDLPHGCLTDGRRLLATRNSFGRRLKLPSQLGDVVQDVQDWLGDAVKDDIEPPVTWIRRSSLKLAIDQRH